VVAYEVDVVSAALEVVSNTEEERKHDEPLEAGKQSSVNEPTPVAHDVRGFEMVFVRKDLESAGGFGLSVHLSVHTGVLYVSRILARITGIFTCSQRCRERASRTYPLLDNTSAKRGRA
jgi:hypothetical protein